jgi:hypothetical protein
LTKLKMLALMDAFLRPVAASSLLEFEFTLAVVRGAREFLLVVAAAAPPPRSERADDDEPEEARRGNCLVSGADSRGRPRVKGGGGGRRWRRRALLGRHEGAAKKRPSDVLD